MKIQPMTATEARSLVAAMQLETSKRSRVRLMQLAIVHGRLSEEAKDVYRAALKEDGAKG